MIHELRIGGLGVIEDATCQFAPGFTAVTGETGAGKTMIVTGLGLLAGGRADAALVRHGAAQAVVEGWFDPPSEPIASVVADAGGSVDDDGLTAARIVAGRARSVLGGRGVPTALLGDVVGELLVIHGQHDQTRLAGRALALLDAYAGPEVQELARRAGQVYGQVRALERELAELRTSAMERARELDVLQYSLEEIAAVDPKPGEDAALAAEAQRLGHADLLVGAARSASAALTGADDAESGADVLSLLSAARRSLESAAHHDDALTAPAATIRSLMAEAADLAADLTGYAADIDADPRRLAAVEERRADLARLTRKYGSDADSVLEWGAQAAARVAQLAGADDRIEGIAAETVALQGTLAELCGQLHERRRAAADQFSESVTAELAALAMPRARVAFQLDLRSDPEGLVLPGREEAGPVAVRATGADEATLTLAANPGAPARPIAQASSGGELSRVMLAIQVVLAGADPVPTMVFDEVDAGVGGAAAIEVGRRLQHLSERTQVIVVTHLAQVAAFADRQLVVTKDSAGAVTASSVQQVAGEQRVRELSRMLGGMAESEAAGAHAQELLDLAARR